MIPAINWLVVPLVFLTTQDAAEGFEDGAPAWICAEGMPRHGDYEPQTSTPPAAITLSTTSYNPGDSITVTMTGDIEGFLIRVQRAPGANDTEEIVGEFTSWPANVKPLSWMPQTGITYNCLTHSDDDNLDNLVFVWRAPSTSVGDVIFKASVVTDYEEFWDSVVSSVVTGSTAETASTYDSLVNADFTDYSFADACGSSKGCLLYPAGCKAGECQIEVAYSTINNQAAIKFEMSAAIDTGYLSLGFSSDKDMGEELTVNCMRSGDTLYVQHAYDRPDYNIRQRITDLSDIHIRSLNGRLYCSFTRDTSLSYTIGGTTQTSTSDLSNKVYLFAAIGNVYTDRDVIKKHTVLPVVSTSKISLMETKISSGTTTPPLLGVHVTFGLFGYFILAGFAMLVGRHFRREMKTQICGDALWFQLHRGTMFCVLILGLISIVLAIIYIEGWNLNVIATVHGIFGIIATALMITNVMMGILRPVKGKARLIFNLAHRICGVLSFVFTIVCLLLGSRVDLLHADVQLSASVLIAAGFVIQIILEIVLEIANFKSTKAKQESTPEATKQNKEHLWTIKVATLSLYGVSTLAITIGVMYLVYTY